MDPQVCGSRDTSDEGEKSAEDIEDQREDRVDSHGLLHGDERKVEEREHAEYCDEHVIVDNRRSALNGNHVSDKCHTDEDEEELRKANVSQ